MATLSWVCLVIMSVMESHLTFLVVWRRLKLIKKIVHFSVSELTSNSDRMVFLHLKHKNPSLLISIASQLFRLHLSRDWNPKSYLILKYKNCWKTPWSSEIILTNTTFRNKGPAFSVSKPKLARKNKFHTYLTRKTLPAEERVSKFHNHRKTPSYQTFAGASIMKVVPQSYGSSLKG